MKYSAQCYNPKQKPTWLWSWAGGKNSGGKKLSCTCNTETDSGLKQHGLHSPGAESSPWNTWICPPDISKTCVRKSREQDILSFQPKVLLLAPMCQSQLMCKAVCPPRAWLNQPCVLHPPCCPAGCQLGPLLPHRWECRASAPHHTLHPCTSQAVPRSCTCSSIAEPERSAHPTPRN